VGDDRYWQTIQALLTGRALVIERPRGQPHPRHPELVYPLDYGYLQGTAAGDGAEIDVWIGAGGGQILTGILCTFDTVKQDAEVKLLAGCSSQEIELIRQFYHPLVSVLYLPKP